MAPRRKLSAAALAGEIRAYCRAHQDPAGAQRYARFFKEGYDAWGILDQRHELFHERQQVWFERYRALGLDGFLDAGALLFASGKYEEGALAIRFVGELVEEFDAAALRRIESWFAGGIRNWAHTDVLCGLVLGPSLAAGRFTLDDLAAWRASPHRFQRRAAPVTLVEFQKVSGDTPALLEFIRPMMRDPERVVHQGLGWLLRELWKKNPPPVEVFLLEWKDEAARLIYQYATEKMAPAAKARFRATKAKPRRLPR